LTERETAAPANVRFLSTFGQSKGAVEGLVRVDVCPTRTDQWRPGFGQKPTFDSRTRIVDNPDRMRMLANFQCTGAVSEPWLVCRNPAPQNLLMFTGW
jgi:hypothetical protein